MGLPKIWELRVGDGVAQVDRECGARCLVEGRATKRYKAPEVELAEEELWIQRPALKVGLVGTHYCTTTQCGAILRELRDCRCLLREARDFRLNCLEGGVISLNRLRRKSLCCLESCEYLYVRFSCIRARAFSTPARRPGRRARTNTASVYWI